MVVKAWCMDVVNDLRGTLHTLTEKKFIEYNKRYNHYSITTDGKWKTLIQNVSRL